MRIPPTDFTGCCHVPTLHFDSRRLISIRLLSPQSALLLQQLQLLLPVTVPQYFLTVCTPPSRSFVTNHTSTGRPPGQETVTDKRRHHCHPGYRCGKRKRGPRSVSSRVRAVSTGLYDGDPGSRLGPVSILDFHIEIPQDVPKRTIQVVV